MKTLLALVGLAIGTCLCVTATCVSGVAFGRWAKSLAPPREEHAPPVASSVPTSTVPVEEDTVRPCSPTSTHEPTPTIVASPTTPSVPAIACTSALVVSVVDGDTILLHNGETVRYIGIDTPETDECYGPEATEMNRGLVEGKTVILIGDVEERGRYGRLLRYVIVDGQFVNAELVRLGYARAESYGDNVMFQQVLTLFERYAIETGAGLWSECEGEQGEPR